MRVVNSDLCVQKLSIPAAQALSLADYKFNDLSLGDDVTLCATARMFIDLNLVSRFHISYEVRTLEVLTTMRYINLHLTFDIIGDVVRRKKKIPHRQLGPLRGSSSP